MNIHPAFYPVIGQARAKQILSMSARAKDKDMVSPLLRAEKGVGKSKVMHAYLDAIKAEKPDTEILYYDSPREFRLMGPEWSKLVETIVSGNPFALAIDEAHEMVTDGTKQHDTLFAFLRKVMDGNNKGKPVQFDDELFCSFNRKNSVICLATNFPDVLDKSGALQSRFFPMELELYTAAELEDIAELMAKANKIKFVKNEKENPLRRIARCGRGSARFLERIFEQLVLFSNSNDKLTEKDVMQALKLLNMFPRGLTANEIRLLKTATVPIRASQFKAMTGIEGNELTRSVGYLSSPEVGFLNVLSSGMQISDNGVRYLENCRKDGFAGV